MKELTEDMLALVSGGFVTDGHRESTNVVDQRGVDKGTYIDANGTCWAPGTPSSVMYPNGGGPSWGSMVDFCLNKGLSANCNGKF